MGTNPWDPLQILDEGRQALLISGIWEQIGSGEAPEHLLNILLYHLLEPFDPPKLQVFVTQTKLQLGVF